MKNIGKKVIRINNILNLCLYNINFKLKKKLNMRDKK